MKTLRVALWASIGTMVLTLIHHVYGAIIYDTPFRLHIAFIALPVNVILLAAYRIFRRNPFALPGRIALYIFIAISLVWPAGLIGLYEGGYNHLLKNILYFGGTGQATLLKLFPPPVYELPNDFLFEASGILQFFTGGYGLYALSRLSPKKLTKQPDSARV